MNGELKSTHAPGSPAYHEESRTLYRNAPPIYHQTYFDEATGGFLLIHEGHHRNEAEETTFRLWAASGKRCILLDEQSEARTADASVDGEQWEHKQISEASSNPVRTMQGALYDGKKQAARVVVLVNRSGVDVEDLNRGTRLALFHDGQGELQVVALVFRSGETQIITRQEWSDGKRFRDPEGNH